MRRITVGAILVALFAAPALAVTVSEMDSDNDSMISFDEMSAFYPDLTDETFSVIDTNDDNLIDETELAVALDSGVIEEPAE
ncbi:hypothetical protein [Halovulum sp. GXIMD14793]